MKDEDIISLVMADYSVAKQARTTPNEKNRRYRKAYFQKEYVPGVSEKEDPKAKTDGRSHVWIGVTRAIVDTFVAAVAGSVFSVDPCAKIEPTEEGDEDASQQFENLFAYRASRHQMNLKHHFKNNWLFQASLYDYAIARVGWKIEKGYMPQVIDVEGEIKLSRFRYPRTRQEIKLIPIYDAVDRPDVEVLDTLLTYPDPHATDFDDSRYFMYLSKTNISAMRKREKTKENPFGFYENIDKIEPNSYPGLEASQKTEGKDELEKQSEANLVQLLPYYTPNAMVVIANNKWVVHKEEMMGFPFSKMTVVQPNHQWSGVGIVEGIEHLQLDINQLVRLRRDNINLIVNPIGIINEILFAHKKQDFKTRPSKMLGIRFGDPTKAIHYERPSDVTQTVTQEVNFQVAMMERISMVGDTMQGIWRQGGRRTATEASQVAEGGASRIGEVAREIEEKNIVDIVYMVYNQEQLHLTEEVKYRILGKHGYEYFKSRKEDIFHKGAFDVRPIGSRYEANRVVKDNQFLQTVSIVSQNPAFMQITDAREVLKKLWSIREKDPERFILDGDKTDYSIPPEMENIILTGGSDLEPGNRDKHEEHIPIHRGYTERPEFIKLPVGIQDNFERHIQAHEQAIEAMEQVGKQGQTALPNEPGNVLGQPFDKAQAGGLQSPAGGRPGGGMPAPVEGGG